MCVRKHRAPKGALRLDREGLACPLPEVRKHRAPKGALRLMAYLTPSSESFSGQKAPSAKRCIKTLTNELFQVEPPPSQKAPSAKRCIKTQFHLRVGRDIREMSESTERQKVHQDLSNWSAPLFDRAVRKHRAPKGALRQLSDAALGVVVADVRKHQAP